MSIVNLFIAAGRAIADWRRRQRAYAELMALDEHSLADIGIRRSQIRALVEGEDVGGREAEPYPPAKPSDFWSTQARVAGL